MKRFVILTVLAFLLTLPSGVYASRAESNPSLKLTVTEETEFVPIEEDISLLSVDTSAEITPDEYYGRGALASLDNGSWLVKFYDALADCSDTLTQKSVSLVGYSGTISDFIDFFNANYKRIVDAYCYDYPSHVYYLNNYLYSDITIDANVSYMTIFPTKLTFTPCVNDEEITETKRQELLAKRKTAEDAADKLLLDLGITADMSDYEKATAIHNAVAYITEYHHEAAAAINADSSNEGIAATFAKYPNIHTMYGALVEHKAVCDGYAKTYQYLLYKVGIPSHIVTGYGGAESHAWNLVKLDGDWYYTDITWDDQSNGIYYSYYNVTTEQLEKDHTIDETDYLLPQCTATLDNYYTKNSADLDVAYVSEQLSDHVYARVYAPDKTINEVYSWFSENIYDIIGDLPDTRDGNIYAATGLGGEYHLIFAKQNGLCADKDFNLAISTSNIGEHKLLQVFYDGNNSITDVRISDIEVESSSLSLINIHPYTDEGEYSKVKYMLWNGSGSLIPICASDFVEY